MMTTTVYSAQSELDPPLWKELPQDLLESVISKLPFSRAVAFGAVSKLWNTDIVPRAARVTAPPILLYCRRGPTGSLQWMRVSHSTNGKTSSLQDFQPTPAFPIAEGDEKVFLTNCEGGLLFFAFLGKYKEMIKTVVACNPITTQFRSLCLPRPLQCYLNPQQDVLIGVVMDTKKQNYLLLVAGLDDANDHATFLYKSSSSTWENGPSVLPTLRELGVGIGVDSSDFESCRSVCYEGNLYWDIDVYYGEFDDILGLYVLKFDVQKETWKVLDVGCPNPFGCWYEKLVSVLPWPKPEGFPENVDYDPLDMWAFSPSLTSVP